MNTVLRILAVLLGLCVLLPGLCTLFFGGAFSLEALSNGRDMYGFTDLALPLLLVGALITWLGIMIFIWTFRRRD